MLSENFKFYFVYSLDSQNISKDARIILKLFNTQKKIRCGDVIEKVFLSRSKAKRELKSLLAQGLIKKMGQGKGTYYSRLT